MSSPKSGKLVRQDADGIWFAAKLAAQRSGLTKPELARRALNGELRYLEDQIGRPAWFLEPEITALARVQAEAAGSKSKNARRAPTQKQLEARYKKQAEELRATSRHFQGGPLLAHGNRVTIAEIFSKPKRNDQDS